MTTTVDAAHERVRVSADIPAELAREFADRSAHLHRSSRAQLRVLIERFLNEQELEPRAGSYTGRSAV